MITVTIMAFWAGCVVWGFSQTEQSGSPPPPASCSTAELKAKAAETYLVKGLKHCKRLNFDLLAGF